MCRKNGEHLQEWVVRKAHAIRKSPSVTPGSKLQPLRICLQPFQFDLLPFQFELQPLWVQPSRRFCSGGGHGVPGSAGPDLWHSPVAKRAGRMYRRCRASAPADLPPGTVGPVCVFPVSGPFPPLGKGGKGKSLPGISLFVRSQLASKRKVLYLYRINDLDQCRKFQNAQ